MKRDFIAEFNRVKQAIDSGKTPVSNEIRMAKTTLLELIPSLIIQKEEAERKLKEVGE